MISVVRIREPNFIPRLSFKALQEIMDMWTASQLNTWMLGRMFVGVSVL